ncbi:MAG: hypothetical protein ACRBCK_06070 [Alphaproteobacteria bacterium]
MPRMMKTHKAHTLTVMALCSSVMLTACNPVYRGGGEPLAQMTFEHVKPFSIYVASYNPIEYPQAETLSLPQGYVANPADLIFDYLGSRYQATGSQGKLRIEIDDITVKHTIEQSSNAVGAALGVAKKDKYTVHAALKIVALGTSRYDRKEVTLKAHRTVTVSEHISLSERENAQMQALDNLLDDLDVTIKRLLMQEFYLVDAN